MAAIAATPLLNPPACSGTTLEDLVRKLGRELSRRNFPADPVANLRRVAQPAYRPRADGRHRG